MDHNKFHQETEHMGKNIIACLLHIIAAADNEQFNGFFKSSISCVVLRSFSLSRNQIFHERLKYYACLRIIIMLMDVCSSENPIKWKKCCDCMFLCKCVTVSKSGKGSICFEQSSSLMYCPTASKEKSVTNLVFKAMIQFK